MSWFEKTWRDRILNQATDDYPKLFEWDTQEELLHDGRAQALSLTELADLMNSTPRIPKRELKCHPSVMAALGDASVPKTGFLPVNPAYLLSIDIFEDDTLRPGEWHLYEDGEVTQSGVLGQ